MAQFEDLDAWRKARELCKLVYTYSAQGQFSREFGLRDQVRRSAVSVLSNIAEGFERGGDKEFRQFLSIAKGSAGELRAQLYIALDAGLLSQQQFEDVHAAAIETSRLLAGLMRYLGGSRLAGSKYK